MCRRQAGGRCLALPVRHGGRYAVDQDAHAAHAEGRAGAESAYRYLQILRVILALPDLQPRHRGQQLRQIDQRRRGAERIDPHRIDRGWRIEAALFGAAGADDDRLQLPDRFLLRMRHRQRHCAGCQNCRDSHAAKGGVFIHRKIVFDRDMEWKDMTTH